MYSYFYSCSYSCSCPEAEEARAAQRDLNSQIREWRLLSAAWQNLSKTSETHTLLFWGRQNYTILVWNILYFWIWKELSILFHFCSYGLYSGPSPYGANLLGCDGGSCKVMYPPVKLHRQLMQLQVLLLQLMLLKLQLLQLHLQLLKLMILKLHQLLQLETLKVQWIQPQELGRGRGSPRSWRALLQRRLQSQKLRPRAMDWPKIRPLEYLWGLYMRIILYTWKTQENGPFQLQELQLYQE